MGRTIHVVVVSGPRQIEITDETASRLLDAALFIEVGTELQINPRFDVFGHLAAMLVGVVDAIAPAAPSGMVAITTNGTTRLIPEDEPVFLLRGQDMYAGDTVRFWTGMVEGTGSDAIVEEATRHAEKMDAWPRKKVPDLPGQHVPIDEHLPDAPAQAAQAAQDEHKGLPVAGYKPTQSQEAVDLVNEGKLLEERLLRWAEKIEPYVVEQSHAGKNGTDGLGFMVDGVRQVQIGCMLLYRAVFQPNGSRISLPEDGA